MLHRGELLGQVSRLKRAIAIAGTHGKTTTCGMAAHALVECGHDPAYLIGGELRSAGTNAAWGEGEWIVVEADESDRSFLELARDVAVVTNVELDHHHTYRSLGELEEAFAEFTAGAGTTIAGTGLQGDLIYGIGEGDLRAEELELHELGASFRVDGVEVELKVPGRHNVLNALAALAACREAGLPIARAAPALASFSGAGRRFEPRGTTPSGARVFDDYAHHPTEVRATLEAARTLGARRVVACFQPHLFSRTRTLARGFGEALALADVVAVLDVYPARERAEDFPGVSGLTIARAAADAGGGRRVLWTPAIEDAAERIGSEAGEGDVVITLGAGDVDRVAELLWDAVREQAVPASWGSHEAGARLPAGAPHHRPDRWPGRLLLATGHARGALRAARVGRFGGHRGRSGGLGIEPPGSRCRFPGTRDEARRHARLDRA